MMTGSDEHSSYWSAESSAASKVNVSPQRRATVSTICENCGRRIDDGGFQTWDDSDYCTECLDDAGLGGLSPSEVGLEEHVKYGFLRALLGGLLAGLLTTTAFTALIGGMLTLIFVGLSLQEQVAGAGRPFSIKQHLQLLGNLWCFFAVCGFLMALLPSLRHRRREIYVNDGRLISEQEHFLRVSATLADCPWRLANVGMDNFTLRIGRAPVVQVFGEKGIILCGHEDQKRQLWTGFLSLVGARQEPPQTALRTISTVLVVLCFIAGGGFIGAALGISLFNITGESTWIGATTILGAVDGGLIVGMLHNIRRSPNRTKSDLHPMFVAATFAVAGVAFGVFAGTTGAIACGIENAVLGLVVGLFGRRRVEN